MLSDIRTFLDGIVSTENDPAPIVPLALFFEGNDQEQSIAPNTWGEGRPSIAEMYETFQAIARRDDVQTVVVGMHFDWGDDSVPGDWPPAENVHIYSSAPVEEVNAWIANLHSDGAEAGWPYGEPANAPALKDGYTVYTVYWD